MSTSNTSVQPDAQTRFQCRHIFTDGLRCGSPCLRKENFCYYHHAGRRAVRLRELETRKAHQEGRSPQQAIFDLPDDLADRSGLQAAIAEVLQRIARNELDPRRAGLLLYGLQIATLTLPREPRAEPRRSGYSRYTGHHEEAPAVTTVEEVELDPELGPLAPVAELVEPNRRPTVVSELLEKLNRNEPYDDSYLGRWSRAAMQDEPQPRIVLPLAPDQGILPKVEGMAGLESASPHRAPNPYTFLTPLPRNLGSGRRSGARRQECRSLKLCSASRSPHRTSAPRPSVPLRASRSSDWTRSAPPPTARRPH